MAGPGVHSTRPWDLVIWLRTRPGPGPGGDGPGEHGPGADGPGRDGEAVADIVVDLHDPAWPVIRHVAAPLARDTGWYIRETQAFFALRAAIWDRKFGADLPAYAAAIAEAGLPRGGVVADVGCGTGRALAALRGAVGPRGTVLAVDLTLEMLAAAAAAGGARAALLAADARRLPLGGATVNAVFAAGLINHLPDAGAGLAELARITRPGGRLVLFHPSGRAALAARHGRPLRPDEPLSPRPLRDAMDRAGWCLDRYDDAPGRFLAVATRGPAAPGQAAGSVPGLPPQPGFRLTGLGRHRPPGPPGRAALADVTGHRGEPEGRRHRSRPLAGQLALGGVSLPVQPVPAQCGLDRVV